MGKKKQQRRAPEHDLWDVILARAKPLMVRYGLHMAVALGLIVVGVLMWRIHGLRSRARELMAWRSLGTLLLPDELTFYRYQLQKPDAAEQVRGLDEAACQRAAEQARGTPAAPWALLRLARLQAAGGQWQKAELTYRRLLRAYPDSPAAEPARVGLAEILEQEGQYAAAAAAYEKLAAAGARSHWLDAGRARELAGEADAALQDYRRFLASDESAGLRGLAQSRLAAVERAELLKAPPQLRLPKPGAAGAVKAPQGTPEDTLSAPAVPGAIKTDRD